MNQTLRFLPLLIIHLIIISLLAKDPLFGDEKRYVAYAENILDGYYTEAEDPDLMDPPGYPGYLALFLSLKLPYIVPKLFNAVLLFFGMFFLFKTLILYTSVRAATIYTYLLGLYYPILKSIPYNNTEPLIVLLFCAFIYFSVKLFRSENIKFKDILLPGILLGYIAMTRVVFCYVILAGLVAAALYYLLFRTKNGLKYVSIFVIGFLCIIPWLIYTYSHTERHFYFSSNGGESLYWMSTNYKKEYGSWHGFGTILDGHIPDMHPSHIVFFDSIHTMPNVERNDILKARAIENIKANPKGYAMNVIANTMRFLVNYPFSYSNQNFTLLKYLIPNLIFLIPFAISLYPAWVYRRFIPFEIYGLMFFILIFCGGSVLIHAENRYFIPVIPFIILWIGFIYSNFVKISLKNKLTTNH